MGTTAGESDKRPSHGAQIVNRRAKKATHTYTFTFTFVFTPSRVQQTGCCVLQNSMLQDLTRRIVFDYTTSITVVE